jgi:8-oxo-dGTP diphosphatase
MPSVGVAPAWLHGVSHTRDTIPTGIRRKEEERFSMKSVDVVAAVIISDRHVLATQRSHGAFKDRWEFPGGKVEPDESPEQALVREIDEELAATIEVGKQLCAIDYDYDTFHLHMLCYRCHLTSGFTLVEHEAMKWVDSADIDELDWLPADVTVVETLKQQALI